jgi:hypothetical protein
MFRLVRHRHSDPITALLLAALLWRLAIPAGFMPATDHPLRLQLCSTVHDVAIGAHASSGSHASGTVCPWASAPGGALLADLPHAPALAPPTAERSRDDGALVTLAHSIERAQRSRAPPHDG